MSNLETFWRLISCKCFTIDKRRKTFLRNVPFTILKPQRNFWLVICMTNTRITRNVLADVITDTKKKVVNLGTRAVACSYKISLKSVHCVNTICYRYCLHDRYRWYSPQKPACLTFSNNYVFCFTKLVQLTCEVRVFISTCMCLSGRWIWLRMKTGISAGVSFICWSLENIRVHISIVDEGGVGLQPLYC